MNGLNYGPVNGHLIGLAMREMVRRAMAEISRQRFIFKAYKKKSHKEVDFVTTADRAAQGIYVKLIRKNFPTFGMVGEEDKLKAEFEAGKRALIKKRAAQVLRDEERKERQEKAAYAEKKAAEDLRL